MSSVTVAAGEAEAAVAAPPHRGAPRTTDRLALLDGLRFVAAAMVVASHFFTRETHAWGGAKTAELFPAIHPLARYGVLGVELFFMISGFVILMTAWGRDLPSFVASRASRLLPAYWVAVLATGALKLLTGTQLTAIDDLKSQVTPFSVLANLTMVQRAFDIPHVDVVFWTLWYELRFYLLIGLLVAVGVTRRRVLAFAMVWPVLGAFAGSSEPFVRNLLIGDKAPFFAVGMLLYVAYREGWSLIVGLMCAFQLTLAVVLGSQKAGGVVDDPTGAASPTVTAVIVLVGFLVIALVATTPLRRISWGWLTALGALTYPLYVIHQYWGYLVIHELHEHVSPMTTVAAAVAVVLVLAALINRLVERPLAPWMRRRIRAELVRD